MKARRICQCGAPLDKWKRVCDPCMTAKMDAKWAATVQERGCLACTAKFTPSRLQSWTYCQACLKSGRAHEYEEWRDSGGQKAAILVVNQAIKRGELPSVKDCNCVDCGAAAEVYEHRDYTKPLEVVPVCRSCNIKRGPAIWKAVA